MAEPVRSPNSDEEGYVAEPQDWNEDLAKRFAYQKNIQLTEDHRDAINFMRECYADHQIASDAHHVMKHLAAGVPVEPGTGRLINSRRVTPHRLKYDHSNSPLPNICQLPCCDPCSSCC
jgi:TusE/DsrC/DsvC family sulfur relay protein